MPSSSGAAVRHSVLFTLRHPIGSEAEREFFTAMRVLEEIPGVDGFEVGQRLGAQTEHPYTVTMAFLDRDAFARYNAHDVHQRFVAERWLPEVTSFVELDYERRGHDETGGAPCRS